MAAACLLTVASEREFFIRTLIQGRWGETTCIHSKWNGCLVSMIIQKNLTSLIMLNPSRSPWGLGSRILV